MPATRLAVSPNGNSSLLTMLQRQATLGACSAARPATGCATSSLTRRLVKSSRLTTKPRGYEMGKGHYLLIEDEELELIEVASTALVEAVAARLIACQKRRYALRRNSEDAPVCAIGPAFQAASWLVARAAA
jgi:hypothetical protein